MTAGTMIRRKWLCVAVSFVAVVCGVLRADEPPPLPRDDDYSLAGLQAVQRGIYERYSPRHYDLPLDVKAEYFEWELWRYHLTSFHQVYGRVRIPLDVGPRPQSMPQTDDSTWNGALLSALSYKFAVTRDQDTLNHIVELLAGLHLFFEATGQPGLPARSVNLADGLPPPKARPYTDANGVKYLYHGDPAKGTVNQLAAGYAHALMLVGDDLPAEARRLAHADLTRMVLHVIEHDYQLTERDGRKTTYGDLTPVVATVGVPFNAQVAYSIVAAGNAFLPEEARQRQRVREQFRWLRDTHHAYYEDPLRSLVRPQDVGGSALVKGMNDRIHVLTAAYVGLMLDLHLSRKNNAPYDRKFLYQLGQTMHATMDTIRGDRNSLANFMWAGMLADPQVFEAIVDRKPNMIRAQVDQMLVDGVDQLRHFPLERFYGPGRYVERDKPQWIDDSQPDNFHWKVNPRLAFEKMGPAGNEAEAAIDYLYAYWLFRYYKLDRHPALVKRDVAVLRPTLSPR